MLVSDRAAGADAEEGTEMALSPVAAPLKPPPRSVRTRLGAIPRCLWCAMPLSPGKAFCAPKCRVALHRTRTAGIKAGRDEQVRLEAARVRNFASRVQAILGWAEQQRAATPEAWR